MRGSVKRRQQQLVPARPGQFSVCMSDRLVFRMRDSFCESRAARIVADCPIIFLLNFRKDLQEKDLNLRFLS